MESEKIDVKEIMKEIRAEIEKRGYTEDLLSFSDIPISKIKSPGTSFSRKEWDHNLQVANVSSNINYYRDMDVKGLRMFIKRIIRKMCAFLILPIVEEQNRFNASVVRALNQMNLYINENDNSKGEEQT